MPRQDTTAEIKDILEKTAILTLLLAIIGSYTAAIFYLGMHTQANTQKMQGSYMQAYENNTSTAQNIQIDGYKFYIRDLKQYDELNNLYGFTYPSSDTTIFIQSNLSASAFYQTCVHEKMHNKGVGSEYHDYIYKNQDNIVDETCLKLLEAR